MNAFNLGNQLNSIVLSTRAALVSLSEHAELTFAAFDLAYGAVKNNTNETIELTIPVGWGADHLPISIQNKYTKQELLFKIQYLAFDQLAKNGVIQLVTIMEAMTEDILRAVLKKYPSKLAKDKKLSIGAVLEATTIEAVHSHAVDTVLNELAYRSATEFAEAVHKLTDITLMEFPAFHRYLEVKATRDVHIHNRGFANTIYIRKSGLLL
jgi:hypothetical protein